MKSLTLRQMRYFAALAEYRHFGRAADVCAVSQPALSMQVRELEAAFGAPLVERGARQVRLTGLGEEVTRRIRDILRDVDALEDIGRAGPDRLSGRLRLGVIPTVAPYLLPALVADLTADHAGLDIRIRETMTPALLADLMAGKLDAAVLALPVSEPELAETALFDEAFVLVRPAADAALPVPNGESLARMRLLLLEDGHCFRDQALSFCAIGGARPRDMLDGSSLATLVQMVAAGLGVTLIPEMAVPVETRSADVAVARFPEPQPARTVGMVWRRSSPLAATLAGIAQNVRRSAAARQAGAS